MHLITIPSARACACVRVHERVNTGQTSQPSFARRNMAITEISVADSIIRGYYYGCWVCTYVRTYVRASVSAIVFVLMHSSRSKANRSSFPMPLMGGQAGILWRSDSRVVKNTRIDIRDAVHCGINKCCPNARALGKMIITAPAIIMRAPGRGSV